MQLHFGKMNTSILSHFHHSHRLLPETEILIYQSLRDFTPEETEEIREILTKFTDRWNRGGTVESATFGLFYNRFIVIAAIQNYDSGIDCSIDTPSNQAIKRIERKFQLSLRSPMHVSYRSAGKVHTLPLRDLREMIQNEELPSDAVIFQNHAKTIKEFEESWEMPFDKSWASALIPGEVN